MRRLPIRAPAPLRRATFRQLWFGMSMSYAGDRLQQLAQAWLVATISGSALAVGGIGVFGALPLLLMPLGGVVADQVNRRLLLIVSQMVGAISTAVIALLVLTNFIAIWHIYLWAFINGLIMLVSRPAYKVVLTEAVPPAEVRSAVAINSMTETSALVLVNAGGSVLMGLLGLPPAFVLNTVTYLVAAGSLWGLPELGQLPVEHSGALSIMRLWVDLVDGISYLARKPDLLHPLLLTFVTVMVTSPVVGLLAAIVQAQDGSIIDLGVFATATSVGGFVGAGFAGARAAGENPTRYYAYAGITAAVALALFALLPLGIASLLPLAIIGWVLFSQAVWNTSRIRQIAGPAYQARLQAITSMAFTLGFSLGLLWAGAAIDRFGLVALLGGALMLAVLGVIVVALPRRTPSELALKPDEPSE